MHSGTVILKFPWAKIAGLRDKLAHHYFGIDLELTHAVIADDLPKLKSQLKGILKTLGK